MTKIRTIEWENAYGIGEETGYRNEGYHSCGNADREYVMDQIKETYRGFGFSQIETPCVEHIENLTSKQGGDNEKLIFKILKRGTS